MSHQLSVEPRHIMKAKTENMFFIKSHAQSQVRQLVIGGL